MNNEQNQWANAIYNISKIENMSAENVYLVRDTPTTQRITSDTGKKKCITSQRQVRYLLDKYEDIDEFEYSPNSFYVISLYFISLKDDQDRYVILDVDSYGLLDEKKPDNNVAWSVPHTIIPIQPEKKEYHKVKEIKEIFNEALPGLDEVLSALESTLFSNLGITSKKLSKGRSYIEYILPNNNAGNVRCNYIREFFVHDVDPAGILNLADPECLRQHRYIPFTILDQLQLVNGFYRFLDKPIPEHIADVLLYDKRLLTENIIKVCRNDLICQMSGLLFIISLVNDHGLISPTNTISTALDMAMLYGNVGKYCIDGPNVIGCLPYKKYNFTDFLCRMYEGMSKFYPSLTLCCTVLYCSFEYGKQYGIPSRAPSLSLPMSFASRDLGLADVWDGTQQEPGILFGWDIKDNNRVIFNPKGAQIFKPTYYVENNRTMNFIMWKKDLK